MTDRVPLGEKEDLHQEFKSRDALKKLEGIAREVVAMLNADGGAVWVGLRDENDRAVAVEPVADADRERRRLRDYLVDTIEPSPTDREVGVEVVPVPGEGQILRVLTHRGQRQPYAHVKEGGRWFLVRISDRTRPMTREELLSRTGGEKTDAIRERVTREILEERLGVQRQGKNLLWLVLRPLSEGEIDLHDPMLREYLLDPALTGNRRSGWNFCTFEDSPVMRSGRLVTTKDDLRVVEIRRNGSLVFAVPLEALYLKGPDQEEIWPLVLLEYPISAFRIAREIYRKHLQPKAEHYVADMALFGLRGWKLRRSSPNYGYFSLKPKEFTEADDFTLERPLVFSYDEVTTEPDRCCYRLLERVYEAFGYNREVIPREFDRQTGRLILPE